MGFHRRQRDTAPAPVQLPAGTAPPYDTAPPDSLPEARERVLRHVKALPHVDTGTAGAVDRLILGWLGQWLEQLAADRAAHRRVLDQQLVRATVVVTKAAERAAHTEWVLRMAIQDHDRAYHQITGDHAYSHPVTTGTVTAEDHNHQAAPAAHPADRGTGDQDGTVVDLPHRPAHTDRAVGD